MVADEAQDFNMMMRRVATFTAALAIAANAFAQASNDAAAGAHVAAQKVSFKSDGLSLVGFLYKPEGDGPFPALIWNHGSEHHPEAGSQFDSVASIFVPAGYVVFAPVRRGHGGSEGTYIVDEIRIARLRGRDAAERTAVRLLESEQLADQLAGLAYVKQLPFVDTGRIAVAGCSYGGIQTLLGAENSGAGYKAAVSLSPAALSWDENLYLQRRLVEAAVRIHVPVLVLQPAEDPSLAPSRVLGKAAAQAGTPLTAKVYPKTGPRKAQGHCFGGAAGIHVWADDAKAFLAAHLP